MSDHPDSGFIKEYGHSKSLTLLFVVLGLLFAGVGVLVLSIIQSVGKTIHFSGNIALLYQVGIGAAAIGALIILATILMMRNQPTYYLSENAIRAVSKNRTGQTPSRIFNTFSCFPMVDSGTGSLQTTIGFSSASKPAGMGN